MIDLMYSKSRECTLENPPYSVFIKKFDKLKGEFINKRIHLKIGPENKLASFFVRVFIRLSLRTKI